MNILHIYRYWIIVLNIVLLLILILLSTYKESFRNELDPSDPNVVAANNNYASVLMFLQKNPSASLAFIKDIKSKFFDSHCNVKDAIDFNTITSMPFGMPFGSSNDTSF